MFKIESKSMSVLEEARPSIVEPTELRCLWLAREIPFPANTGDRIYSGHLSEALQSCGVQVNFLGLDTRTPKDPPHKMTWIAVPGVKRPNTVAVFSKYPLVTAAHAGSRMRHAVDRALEEDWDAIVIDHYGMAWTLDRVKRYVRRRQRRIPIVHVTHNHEEALALALFKSNRNALSPRSAVLYLNYLKIRHWERRLISETDIVGAITAEDRGAFAKYSSRPRIEVLTPGHSGMTVSARTMSQELPRRVILLGSYRWKVKEQNLRQLLHAADARFSAKGISLEILGDVPEGLLEEFSGRLNGTRFHGFVADVSPLFSTARLALVPEVIGGGFKLKFLDYIFGRVPIATIAEASAGLPDEIRRHLIKGRDLDDLVDRVIECIDDIPRLEDMQNRAFDAASELFDWRDRGMRLRDAITHTARGFQ